ncbi:MAG: hypothetical protein MUE60_04920 [Candidatus Eisenbacteria bacterium]|jgi:hypothetical protein|nr:hypothetical protein [Candidatus Eisenbacteria bacterium]
MRPIAIAVVVLVAASSAAHAQTYFLQQSVIGAGGGPTSGATYAVNGTLGQSSPVGTSAGATYRTSHGFWHAVGWAPLEAMVLSIQLVSSTTARLLWDPVALAAAYDLYRSTSPYFAATGSVWQTVSAPTTQYDFAAGIGDPAVTYYFKGKARNAAQVSTESNTVGEYERSTGGVAVGARLTPGEASER